MNIVFIGISTSWKTTVWKTIAKYLNMQWFDEDEEFEKIYWSIGLMKKEKGRDYFLGKRKEFIENTISKLNNCVISAGWWTMKKEDLKYFNWFIIFLKINENTLIARFNNLNDNAAIENTRRSLLYLNDYDKIQVLKERLPYYENNSDMAINANKSIQEVIQDSLKIIQNKWYH